ncbi:putative Ig domain-containing protein [Gemmata sp. JC673]|uniref:Ig domain-containing protein n=1 Tax=Gemmata algarum TaxID=2975278 RepID=A0ABU5ER26_9BACT|nr:putative Ig domain-containing protein [Gemmata algarum]
MTITNSTLSTNTALYGGAVGVGLDFAGTVSVTNSTLSTNTADYGGAVCTAIDYGGATTLTNSTVSGNTATYGGGGLAALYGGNDGTLDLVNSTVSGNTAAYGGGALFTGAEGTLTNSTVTANRGYGGGLSADGWIAVTVRNSIVAGNLDPTGATPDDLFVDSGIPFLFNYSLIGVGDSLVLAPPPVGTGNQIGTLANPLDPRLGPLANNGGLTYTHALLADSPARDMGDPDASNLPPTDQRGQTRVLGGRVDIGAVEFVAVAIGPDALPAGTVGTAYAVALTATGASGPFVYTVTAGALPPGVTLSAAGQLTGAPTAVGAYTFTVAATDSSGASGSREFALTVAAAAAPPKFVLGAGNNGRVQIAGGDGTSIPAFNGFQGEVRVATTDLNGDGVMDIVAGAGAGSAGGHVKVFDGATGALIRSFFTFDGSTGGVFVGAADLDGDGTDEILVGADAGADPRVNVYGTADRPQLSFLAYAPAFRGGVRVAGFDVDGDGRDEILTGSGAGAAGDGRVFDSAGRVLSSQIVADVLSGIFVG